MDASQYAQQVRDALQKGCRSLSLEDYVDGLEDVLDEVQSRLEAARSGFAQQTLPAQKFAPLPKN